jgi:NitT/TauT family transport system substrate-binding protein
VAHDAGYFAKEGLADDIILIPSGTQLAQVTVAGEIDIGSLNGSSAIAAALSGADLKIIGNSGNKMVFSLYVRPEFKTVESLKGKKIGITRYGSAPDISVRYALRKFNINPDKDLTLIQLGFMATVAAGLQGGSIEGGVVSPPTQFAIDKAGLSGTDQHHRHGLRFSQSGAGGGGLDHSQQARRDQPLYARLHPGHSSRPHRP